MSGISSGIAETFPVVAALELLHKDLLHRYKSIEGLSRHGSVAPYDLICLQKLLYRN